MEPRVTTSSLTAASPLPWDLFADVALQTNPPLSLYSGVATGASEIKPPPLQRSQALS